MKKITSLFVLSTLSLLLFSQTSDEPYLEVVGSAKIVVTPDVGTLIIQIQHIDSSFSKAITHLNRKTKDINSQLTKVGFKETEIKTTNFEVNENSIYRRGERIDSGYVATQDVKVDFDNEGTIIENILTQFSGSETDLRISFRFKLSEKTKTDVQEKVIELAVKNAFKKAEQIAKYSNAEIKSLRRINYGNNYSFGMREVQDRDETFYFGMAAPQESSLVGFTPNDMIFQDQVLVSWILQ